MTKRRRLLYKRRERVQEKIDDGQDSFLDVVSNLVGILIILVMIAGARVRNATSAPVPPDVKAETSEEARERESRRAYVEAADLLEKTRVELEQTRAETEDFNERALILESQTQAAEQEYRDLLRLSAEIDGALKAEAQNREESERVAFDLKSQIFEKEKKRDDLLKQKQALEAARPQATQLENLPTPISKRVEEGHEGFFRLKNGKLAHVPLNEFTERVRLYFKNFHEDVSKNEFEEKIGPVEDFYFHYFVTLDKVRGNEGLSYLLQFQFGECVPTRDDLGEPVDEALSNANSAFRNRLAKYSPADTTITLFVYPDSFQYLRDLKKFLFTRRYQTALRPLPQDAPIAISPQGTASASY